MHAPRNIGEHTLVAKLVHKGETTEEGHWITIIPINNTTNGITYNDDKPCKFNKIENSGDDTIFFYAKTRTHEQETNKIIAPSTPISITSETFNAALSFTQPNQHIPTSVHDDTTTHPKRARSTSTEQSKSVPRHKRQQTTFPYKLSRRRRAEYIQLIQDLTPSNRINLATCTNRNARRKRAKLAALEKHQKRLLKTPQLRLNVATFFSAGMTLLTATTALPMAEREKRVEKALTLLLNKDKEKRKQKRDKRTRSTSVEHAPKKRRENSRSPSITPLESERATSHESTGRDLGTLLEEERKMNRRTSPTVPGITPYDEAPLE
jgi:hypothetical protein